MAKYDYSSVIKPVFIEKVGGILPAHAQNYNVTQINSSNKSFSFYIENEEYPIDLFDAEVVVTATLCLNKSSNPKVPLADNINSILINNFFVALFSQAKLEIAGEQVEDIQNIFYSSTMLKYCMKSKDYQISKGQIEAWIPDSVITNTTVNNFGREERKKLYKYNDSKTFKFSYKLSDIFGFCRDYRKPLTATKFKITFQRGDIDENDQFVFHTAAGEAVAADGDTPAISHESGHIQLDDIELSLPYNQLNTEANTHFLEQFNGDREIDLVFDPNRCQTGNTSNTSGEHTIEIVKSTQPVSGVLICFTGNQMNDYKQNGAVFTLNEITEFQLMIGTHKFPHDKPIIIDTTNGYLQELYKLYCEFCLSFGHEPQMNYLEYKANPFIAIRTTKQQRNLISDGATIYMKFKKSGTTVYTWYALVLENTWYKAKLKSNGMSDFRLINWNKKN